MRDWIKEDGIQSVTFAVFIIFLTGKKLLSITPRFMEGPITFNIGKPQVYDATADEHANDEKARMGEQEIYYFFSLD